MASRAPANSSLRPTTNQRDAGGVLAGSVGVAHNEVSHNHSHSPNHSHSSCRNHSNKATAIQQYIHTATVIQPQQPHPSDEARMLTCTVLRAITHRQELGGALWLADDDRWDAQYIPSKPAARRTRLASAGGHTRMAIA